MVLEVDCRFIWIFFWKVICCFFVIFWIILFFVEWFKIGMCLIFGFIGVGYGVFRLCGLILLDVIYYYIELICSL